MSKVVVLTNDLQYALVQKTQERIDVISKATPRMQNFFNNMRSLKVPIIHLQLISDPDDPNGEVMGEHLLVPRGSDGTRILEEFLHEDDIIMEKHKYSGFYGTDLDETLKKLGIKTVIITGMQAQICVQTTAADAFFRGYKVVVPEDGIIATRPEDIQRALAWLDGYCANSYSCDYIYKHLLVHDDFDRKVISYIP